MFEVKMMPLASEKRSEVCAVLLHSNFTAGLHLRMQVTCLSFIAVLTSASLLEHTSCLVLLS